MSSSAYVPPLRIERRPSRHLQIALAVAHGFALLTLIPLPLVGWIKVLVALAISMQWGLSLRLQAALTSASAVNRLVWLGDNSWELYNRDGAPRMASLQPGAYVHPWLVILRFVTEDGHGLAVVLPRDGLDSDSHRRLRVQLQLLQGAR